jgi:hypothetical protein
MFSKSNPSIHDSGEVSHSTVASQEACHEERFSTPSCLAWRPQIRAHPFRWYQIPLRPSSHCPFTEHAD